MIHSIKHEAHELIDHLPDSATWDDVLREIIERQAIEKGIAASNEDRVMDSDELRKRYGLKQ